MKHTFLSRLAALLLVLACLAPFAGASHAARDPIYDLALDSQGVYLWNPETDTVLYEKNARMRMYPASTTKILTALVVLDHCPDPSAATITATDVSLFAPIIEDGAVHMDIRQGETFTVQDLLTGMMLNSFCDAAQLLAWYYGGESVENFVDMMNEKAAQLGMDSSHFTNAHGLHDPDHWSCPRDIALLLKKAVEDDRFLAIISTRRGTIPASSLHGARELKYTVDIFYENNKYYSDYYLDAFVGGKSGFTDEAGRCLAAYSKKDGVSYVSVLMGANLDGAKKYGGKNMAWIETSTLVRYAYENFSPQTLLEKGQKIADLPVRDSDVTLPVVAGEDVVLLARNGVRAEYSLDLPENIGVEEVEDGVLVGRATVFLIREAPSQEPAQTGEEPAQTGEAPEPEREEGPACPLLLQWDGTPVPTKNLLEKEGEKAGQAIRRIFSEDRNFVILVILVAALVIISIPAVKITQRMMKKRAKRPKH